MVTEFEISRKEWFRGRGSDCSRLLIIESEAVGMKCCMGIYALACGMAHETIEGVPTPSGIAGINGGLPSEMLWLLEPTVDGDSEENFLASINDDRKLDAKTRERCIRDEFAKQGITVRFVN